MTEKEEKRQLRQERRAIFAALSGAEKWQYFRDYYMKGTILTLILLFLLAGLCRDLWRGARKCVFYALVVNSYTEVPDAFREEFISYAGLDDEKYNIIIDSAMKIDLERMDDMTSAYMQEIIAISSTRKQDVFLADEAVTAYYWDAGYIADIREALPEEFWKTYESRFYYLNDPDGNKVPVGILVADSPRLAEYGMYENQQPIVSAVYQAPDAENIQAFMSYLYTE